MRALGLSLVVAHLSLLVGTAQAQLQYCADDLIAYDPVTDLSWVTDYSPQTGYRLFGCLISDCLGGETSARTDTAGVDAGGFSDWRVPTLSELLSIIPQTPDCPDAGGGVCLERPWRAFGGKWWVVENCWIGASPGPGEPGPDYCGGTSGFNTVVAVGTDTFNGRGDVQGSDWYGNWPSAAVRTGNACESAPAVPTTGAGILPLGFVLATLTLFGMRQVSASRA